MFGWIDMSLVDWSRAQFALTALYHWIFVPLTLGIIFIIAIMEGIYVKTWDKKWEKIVKFWMKLMAINFAIWVATGIILEFEFGTNWSNYSWFVWDIFWAPLAIEWIMAFFLESVMMAVMFWGWWKMSKEAHVRVTWATAIWTNLSAIWILSANAWMQYPVWMQFNPDTMRNEMINFWDVIFSPIAMNKFLHVVSTSYVYAAAFMLMVASWYLLKGREKTFAKKSLIVASTFWFIASIVAWVTWDIHAKEISKHQPMKLAAMEALYNWEEWVWLKLMATFGEEKVPWMPEVKNAPELPKWLSYLAFSDINSFVPWINDLLYWNNEYYFNEEEGRYLKSDWSDSQRIIGYVERIPSWKIAIQALYDYKQAKKLWNEELAKEKLELFRAHEKDFGFWYFDETNLSELIPNVPLMFYTFRIMVWVGSVLPLIFLIVLLYTYVDKIENKKWVLKLAMLSFFLAFLWQELGWVVAEVGRQPWTVQNMLPTKMSTSHLSVWSVQLTFFLFLAIFTALIIAEFTIMIRAIKDGPKIDEK